jgi:hypothetical protein
MAFTYSKEISVQRHPGYFLELAQVKLTSLGVIKSGGELQVLRPNDKRGAAQALRTAEHIYALHDMATPPTVAELQERLGQ